MDLGRLVSRDVIDDEVNIKVFRHAAVDQVQEATELESAVMFGHVGDDMSRSHVEGGIEIGRAPRM